MQHKIHTIVSLYDQGLSPDDIRDMTGYGLDDIRMLIGMHIDRELLSDDEEQVDYGD